MSNFLRTGFIAIALTFVFSLFAVTETNAQIINEVLKRMDEHYKSLKSLQADITREMYNPQTDDTDKMSGSISLVPGKDTKFSMRLDWEKPRKETISVVNGKYVLYTPGTGQALTGDSSSKKLGNKGGGILKLIGRMDKAEIKANYNVEYLGQEGVSGDVQTWHLKLTPKVNSDFKFADIWVDGNGMPLQVKITQPNNETDTILLTKLKKNDSLNASIFKVSLPPGTKIIKG
jgi:outer membrane lipoprotein-sorting protein